MIFVTALILGISVLGYQLLKGKEKLHYKNLLGGIALGIPNYYSIYFLVQALRHPSLESSTVFTLNNVGIVMAATLIGILFFKEKLFCFYDTIPVEKRSLIKCVQKTTTLKKPKLEGRAAPKEG